MEKTHKNGNCSSSNGNGGGGDHLEGSSVSDTNYNENNGTDDFEDEYCVYTYKGTNQSNCNENQMPSSSKLLADLPSCFFKFESSNEVVTKLNGNGSGVGVDNGPLRSALVGLNISEASASNSRSMNNNNIQTENGQPGQDYRAFTSSSSNNNGQGDVFSPEMDFLEMDFDPGGSDDISSPNDTDPENNINFFNSDFVIGNGVNNLNSSTLNSTNRESRKDPSSTNTTNINSEITDKNSFVNINTTPKRNPGPSTSTSSASAAATGSSASSENSVQKNPQKPQMISLRLVKSNTVPEFQNQNQRIEPIASTSGGSNISSSSSSGGRSNGIQSSLYNNNDNEPNVRLPSSASFSSSLPFIQESQTQNKTKTTNGHCTALLNTSTQEDLVEVEVGSVMIWSVQVAEQQIKQIGRSACGATAILNVLSALGLKDFSSEYINECVGTKLRAENADLPEYLFSRSGAGATAQDLIQGMSKATNGEVYGKFFRPSKDISPESLSKWIMHWICKGAIPIITRNLQKSVSLTGNEEIPDSWHHQMVFGIKYYSMADDNSEAFPGVYMNNPVECVSLQALLPELISDSCLLVRRKDVISRKRPKTDLRKLARHVDYRWNQMNVLGQVANMLLEESPVVSGSTLAKRVRSTHITIPADYEAGFTLFIHRDSSAFNSLIDAYQIIK